MTRKAKTELVHVVQGNYGYGDGWEDLAEYRVAEPYAAHRLIMRRVPVQEASR